MVMTPADLPRLDGSAWTTAHQFPAAEIASAVAAARMR